MRQVFMSCDSQVKICEPGGGGILLPLFGEAEQEWRKGLRAVLYLLGLLWLFLAVSVVSDIFMGAIEEITSKKKRILTASGRHFTIKVWNDTVANLTLMALGSSAPEILLSVIELLGNSFYSGDLGPSTIVGSAAFNLFCISAVCVLAIKDNEVRYIKDMNVYLVTAFVSVFAYLWLYLVVSVISEDIVDIYEGVLTFFFFPMLVGLAFAADKGYLSCIKERESPHAVKAKLELTDDDLIRFSRERWDPGDSPSAGGVFIENGAQLTDSQVLKYMGMATDSQKMSKAAYRKKAQKELLHGKPVDPKAPRIGLRVPPRARASHPAARFRHGGDRTFSAVVPVEEPPQLTGEPPPPPLPSALVLFGGQNFAVLETVGVIRLPVLRTGDLGLTAARWSAIFEVMVDYCCKDGLAKDKEDYQAAEGTLTFLPDEVEKTIEIIIVKDDVPEDLDNEDFFVELANPRSSSKEGFAELGSVASARVIIVDTDVPSIIYTDEDCIMVHEAKASPEEGDSPRQMAQEVHLTVRRKDGCGPDGCAVEGHDYEGLEGELHFEPHEMTKEPRVEHYIESLGVFTKSWLRSLLQELVISILESCSYNHKLDGGPVTGGLGGDQLQDVLRSSPHQESCVVTLVITPQEVAKDLRARTMRALGVNWQKTQKGHENWKDQFINALLVNGGDDEAGPPSGFQWALHLLTLPWKVVFAMIPPVDYCGGWLCFYISLCFIGMVTALISDLAGLVGCVLDLPDFVTAITLVALGTSLPDTFASKAAAEQDPYADASIGNVTGSNSVNVFLGLGLPWTIGSIYWAAMGRTEEWQTKYSGQARFESWNSDGGKFVVIGGDLGYSVVIFSAGAVLCMSTLFLRRKAFGGELGGPRRCKHITAVFLVLIWCTYVEWNNQFRDTLNRAASSVQRLAEQAELHQLGEQFLASAQTLAEQGEAAWSNVADKVSGGVSSLGLTEDSPRKSSDLAPWQWGGEGCLVFCRPSWEAECSRDPRLAVQRSVRRPSCEERLHSGDSPKRSPMSPSPLKVLLQSKALLIAMNSLTRSRAGRVVISAAADSKSGANRPALEHDAANTPQDILQRSTAVPAPLVKQLLTLLSEAAEENCQARREGAASMIDAAAQEGETRKKQISTKRHVGQDLHWILALFSASFLDPSEVEELHDELLEGSPKATETAEDVPVGAEVWASWPGDGRWFRAKVTDVTSSGVGIAWLRRGAGDGQALAVCAWGEEGNEFLSSTGGDELLFTRLPSTSVTTAKERPEQAVLEKADRWRQQLGRVEELSHRFRNLRTVCQKLAQSAAEPSLVRDPLEGMAERLVSLRKKSEGHVTDLLGAVEARASAGGGINEQLTSSSEGFQAEIDSMQQEQQALQSRLNQLQADRQELLKKLQALDEEIAVATSAYQAAAQRERQVRASAKRVAGELKRELSLEEVEARKVGDRQRLLMEAQAASRDIEAGHQDLIESRTEAAAARIAAQDRLPERQAKASALCLQSEKDRARAFEELLAGWHAAEISRAAERYKEMMKEVKSNLDRMKALEASPVPVRLAVHHRRAALSAADPSGSRHGDGEDVRRPEDGIRRPPGRDPPHHAVRRAARAECHVILRPVREPIPAFADRSMDCKDCVVLPWRCESPGSDKKTSRNGSPTSARSKRPGPWTLICLTPFLESEPLQISFIFEQVFTSAFVIELTLSTLCWGWTSLCARENWLDVFLVFLGVLTTWVFGLFGLQIDFLRTSAGPAGPLIWPSDGSAHWWVAGFFVLFIAVGVFVMLNLVTAVVVETGFSDSKSEEKELAIRMEREKEEELEDLKQFFLQIDLDGSGSLTKQEFFKATKQRRLARPFGQQIRNKLRALDIMPKDIDELWDILDDGQGELEVEAFQSGIRKLRGEAKSKDILKLSKELRQFEMSVDEVEGFIESSKHRLKSVNHQLTRCRGDIAAFTRTLVRAKEAVKMAAQTQNMS
eukprot:g21540.t1